MKFPFLFIKRKIFDELKEQINQLQHKNKKFMFQEKNLDVALESKTELEKEFIALSDAYQALRKKSEKEIIIPVKSTETDKDRQIKNLIDKVNEINAELENQKQITFKKNQEINRLSNYR